MVVRAVNSLSIFPSLLIIVYILLTEQAVQHCRVVVYQCFRMLRQPTIVGFNLFYKPSLDPLMDVVGTFET